MNGWMEWWVDSRLGGCPRHFFLHLSMYCINKVLKSGGYCVPSRDLLLSAEWGTASNTCLHGVNRNGWCPVARSGNPLSFSDVIRIGIAKAIKWDNLENAGVSPATFGCYYAVQKKQSKTKLSKGRQGVDVPWPGCSLPIWQEPTDKGCCVCVTFPCVPIGMNNEGQSPCLSFNSIFTPCQIHLGAFHHHCSPSAEFSQ